MPAYVSRTGALEPTRHWSLDDDALICSAASDAPPRQVRRIVRIALRILLPWLRTSLHDRWPPRVAYRDIRSIRLRHDPTRFDRNRFRCDLRGPRGARISIFSTSYRGPGDFEDRSDRYSAFVLELVLRTQRANTQTPVHSGLSWSRYLLQHGLLLLSFAALVVMLAIAGVPAAGLIWIAGATLLAYAGVLWRSARRNAPRNLSLPPGSAAHSNAPRIPP